MLRSARHRLLMCEDLAVMHGVRRPGVTGAALRVHAPGLIGRRRIGARAEDERLFAPGR